MLHLIDTFTPATATATSTPNAVFLELTFLGTTLVAAAIVLSAVVWFFFGPDSRKKISRATAAAGVIFSVLLFLGGIWACSGAFALGASHTHADQVNAAAVVKHNTVGAADWLEHAYGIHATPKAAGLLVDGRSLVVEFHGKLTNVLLGDSATGGKVLLDEGHTPLPQDQ